MFFHKKDVESSDGEDKKELGWRERRSQNDEDSEVSYFKKPYTLGCPKKSKSPNFGMSLTPVVFIG